LTPPSVIEYGTTTTEIDVVNTTSKKISSGDFIDIAQTADGVWVVVEGLGGGGAEIVYANVEGKYLNQDKHWLMTPVHWTEGIADLPGQFVFNMSGYPDWAQPVYPGVNGLNPVKLDQLILVRSQSSAAQQPAIPPYENYDWLGFSQRIAKFITGTLTIPADYSFPTYRGNGDVGSWWEGHSPGSYVEVDYYVPDFLRGCKEPQTINFWASWKPFVDRYEVISTPSAMLGEAKKFRAKSGPMTIKEEESPSGDCSGSEESSMVYEQEEEDVATFGECTDRKKEVTLTINVSEFSDCFNEKLCELTKECITEDDWLCEYICENCEGFAAPDDCVECKGKCDFEWQGGAWQPGPDNCEGEGCTCPDGPTPEQEEAKFGENYIPADGDEISIPCEGQPPPPECEGDCTWLFDGTQWGGLDFSCVPANADCRCLEPPTDQEILDAGHTIPPEAGDQVTKDCGPNLPPEQEGCDPSNCPPCHNETLRSFVSSGGASVPFEVEGDNTSYNSTWTFDADDSKQTIYEGCVWKVTGEWGGAGPDFQLLPKVPMCVTVARNGDGSYTVSPDKPDSMGNDGSFTTDPPADCDGGSYTNPDPDELNAVKTGNVSIQTQICGPQVYTGCENEAQAGVGVSPIESAASTDRIDLRMIASNPELLKGCKCKKDVLKVMKRWVPGEVKDSQIARVTKTLAAKTKKYTEQEIFDKIKAICG